MKNMLEWIILLAIGGGLFGGGFVTGCVTGRDITQTTTVTQNTSTKASTESVVTSMQGQVTIILNSPDSAETRFFNINLKGITNMTVSQSNFTDRFTVTNGKTNR